MANMSSITRFLELESNLKSTKPVLPSTSYLTTHTTIDKSRLEHLLNLEKHYVDIIAYGVKHAIETNHSNSDGVTGSVNTTTLKHNPR
jgi:hypothetical protein